MVDDHSTETVGGVQKIEALGALKLLSGGSASSAAVDDLHQATDRYPNQVVGQKRNTALGGDMQERMGGALPLLLLGRASEILLLESRLLPGVIEPFRLAAERVGDAGYQL